MRRWTRCPASSALPTSIRKTFRRCRPGSIPLPTATPSRHHRHIVAYAGTTGGDQGGTGPALDRAESNNTNIGAATWTYSLPDQAFDFLAAGETLTLTYMARVDTNYIEYNTSVVLSRSPSQSPAPTTCRRPRHRFGHHRIAGNRQFGDRSCRGRHYVCGCRPDRPADRDRAVYQLCLYAANGSPLTLTPTQHAALAAR